MFELLKKILQTSAYAEDDKKLIERAFLLAQNAHNGQKRLSGDDYFTHPLQVAYFLSELGLDSATIAAAILHDTLEDTALTPKDLEKEFGKEITFLVQGVSKLGKIKYPDQLKTSKKNEVSHLNSLKKMFFAMAEDVRVILIKLADRYHNMETLSHMPESDQKRIALETLEIYAPIAARLGMGRLKGQLEDMAFPYIYPIEYSELIKKVKEKYADRLKYIERTKPLIRRCLTDAGIKIVDLDSRAKHYYSLYQKTLRKELTADKVFDLVAMRVIVPDIKSCYEALGVIHKFYKPLPGLIKDYIALPKPNGYQSIHTTIFCEKGRIVEIQIRTEKMHDYAENGIAAHWAYSESGKKNSVTAGFKEIQWINQLKDFLQGIKSGEALANLKIDFFKNRIFAFTPRGEVKDLPEGATPIDFSYAIHTDLGHLTRGAKVNSKIVPLHYELKNGDVVEIVKGKDPKPSFDWLKIVKTAEAKKKIKSWFKENSPPEEIVGKEPAPVKKIIKTIAAVKSGEPIIQGQKGLLYKIAKCCNPSSDQKIKGYMTVNRGVSIHTATCSNLKTKNGNGNRILTASWSVKK